MIFYEIIQVALEAAQAYNRVKPPHQTVGDAVMMSLQHASQLARKQREKGMGSCLSVFTTMQLII